MYIRPKANAKDLWDINEDIAMEALLVPKNDEVPCPWDASIEIKGDQVILDGGMAPGGPAHGKCVCTFPVSQFSDYVTLEIPDSVVSDQMSEEDLQTLWDAGWERV